MRRLLFLLALAAVVTAGTGAAAQTQLPVVGGDVAVPVASMRQSRLAGTLVQQYDFSCGSAAVATLLTHHYGYPTSEATVFEQMFRNGDQQKIRAQGFSLLDMKRFLKAHGFEADGFEQPLEKLAEARVPAIALINENGYQHFVVIKGLRGERVLIGDPANGTRAMSRERFLASWSSRLLFVVHNRMSSARFNQPSDWRAAPRAPLTAGADQGSPSTAALPKHGPGDF